MDLKTIRAAVRAVMKAQKITQEDMAARTGLGQGHISNILNLEQPDLAARVLFQIIEEGLGKSLTEFFSEIEGGTVPATRAPATTAGVRHGDLVPPPIVADPRLARLVGNALVKAGSDLIAAQTGGGTTGQDRAMEEAGRKEPRRRRRRAGNR